LYTSKKLFSNPALTITFVVSSRSLMVSFFNASNMKLGSSITDSHDVAFDIPPVGYERFPPVGTETMRKDDPTLIRGNESHRNERDPEAV
jgi:hypothetical protein